MFSLRKEPDVRSLFGSIEALSLTHQPKGFVWRPFFKVISQAVTLYIKTFHLSLSLGSGSALVSSVWLPYLLEERACPQVPYQRGPLTLMHCAQGLHVGHWLLLTDLTHLRILLQRPLGILPDSDSPSNVQISHGTLMALIIDTSPNYLSGSIGQPY